MEDSISSGQKHHRKVHSQQKNLAMRVATAFGLVCVVFLYSAAVDAKLPSLSEWPKLIDDVFKALDLNNDLQVAAAELDKFLMDADANKDGCLSLDEFLLSSHIPADVSESIYNFLDNKKENCVKKRTFYQLFAITDRPDLKQQQADQIRLFRNPGGNYAPGRPAGYA